LYTKFIFYVHILLKNISLIISKKYNFTCVFNNLEEIFLNKNSEEILNKIMVFLEIFYYKQTIVLKVAFMIIFFFENLNNVYLIFKVIFFNFKLKVTYRLKKNQIKHNLNLLLIRVYIIFSEKLIYNLLS
jgi:hypothetical protein